MHHQQSLGKVARESGVVGHKYTVGGVDTTKDGVAQLQHTGAYEDILGLHLLCTFVGLQKLVFQSAFGGFESIATGCQQNAAKYDCGEKFEKSFHFCNCLNLLIVIYFLLIDIQLLIHFYVDDEDC